MRARRQIARVRFAVEEALVPSPAAVRWLAPRQGQVAQVPLTGLLAICRGAVVTIYAL